MPSLTMRLFAAVVGLIFHFGCFAQQKKEAIGNFLAEEFVFFDSLHFQVKTNSLLNPYELIKELPNTASPQFIKTPSDSHLISLPSVFQQIHHDFVHAALKKKDTLNGFDHYKTAAFALSKHEVSNKQYKQFVDYVKDSIKREMLIKEGLIKYCFPNQPKDAFNRDYRLNYDEPIDDADTLIFQCLLKNGFYLKETERFYKRRVIDERKLIYAYKKYSGDVISLPIYPDTSCWGRLFTFSYPFFSNYFWHPSYDHYPVVGVSYNQAEAYTVWLTQQYQNSNSSRINFRLPSCLEYESLNVKMDALSTFKLVDRQYSKSKKRSKRDQQIQPDENAMANHGGLKLNESIQWIYPDEDGYPYTAPVTSFPQNIRDSFNRTLYNIQGNVAEWTSTSITGIPSSLKSSIQQIVFPENSSKIISETDESAIRNGVIDGVYLAVQEKDSIVTQLEQKCKRLVEEDQHLIAEISDNAIVKGGSWHQSPLYLDTEVTSIYSKTAQLPFIGFRLAITIDEELYNQLKSVKGFIKSDKK